MPINGNRSISDMCRVDCGESAMQNLWAAANLSSISCDATLF